jgi:hypothetical protein
MNREHGNINVGYTMPRYVIDKEDPKGHAGAANQGQVCAHVGNTASAVGRVVEALR